MCREVYAIEVIEPLARRARAVVSALGYDNVAIVVGDGSLGYPERAPYDRVIVAAAAPAIPPPLVEQLSEGGRIVGPVGQRTVQECQVGTKVGGELRMTGSIGCVFVPLVGSHGWGPPG